MANNNELDVEQKFAKAIVDLRSLRPFYSAVYEAMERVETDRVPTMAVSTTKMMYNEKFVDGLTYPEFLFINLHEICHVALMHVSRRGNRDPKLWNLACDLYINKLLAEEFNIKPGISDSTGSVFMPVGGCWCSTIDINTECAESIYEEFDKQAKENGYYSDLDSHFSGHTSDKIREALSGDGNEEAEGDSDGDGNGEPNTNENNQQKPHIVTTSRGYKGLHKSYKFTYTGTKKSDGRNWRYNNSDDSEEGKTFTYNMDITYEGDILDTGEDDMKKENDNKRILSEAKTRYDMSKNAGNNAGLLKFRVDEILKSHIDWRKWLAKYCIKARAHDSSFSNPDKRMFYQNAIYPGQAMDESNTIKNIKVCIDTSGSISNEDLMYIFGQIKKLSKQYKIEAEVIAWDTSMESCGNIDSGKDIRSVELVGRGGTDPSCVFEYFDSKKCKVKPVVTLMFTDGYWTMQDNPKWAKKYRDTLWILTKDANSNFTPPFGLVTEVKYGK